MAIEYNGMDNFFRFWGVRGSHAAPQPTHLGVGGNTSCVELRVDGAILIFDGGTGIIALGHALEAEFADAAVKPHLMVLITHYHWDHICGLPFFAPAFSPAWRITFFGPGEHPSDVEKRLLDQMRAPFFPVEIEQWMAQIDHARADHRELHHGPFAVRQHNAHHPGVTFADRVRAAGKTLYRDTVECAMEAGVRHLYLLHHDPAYSDEKIADTHADAQAQIVAAGSKMRCDIAREGAWIAL